MGAAAFLAGALLPPVSFLASCLNLKLLFFLLIMTLNLSKSFKLALLALKALFLAMEVAAHFSLSLYASAAALLIHDYKITYLTVPVRAPLRILGTLRLVRPSLLRGY